MYKTLSKPDEPFSPIGAYKNQTKITPPKFTVPIGISPMQNGVIPTIVTGRSSVSGSTNSYYTSANSTIQKHYDNITPSYINKYNNLQTPISKHIANFEPNNNSTINVSQDRLRTNSNHQNNRPSSVKNYMQTPYIQPTHISVLSGSSRNNISLQQSSSQLDNSGILAGSKLHVATPKIKVKTSETSFLNTDKSVGDLVYVYNQPYISVNTHKNNNQQHSYIKPKTLPIKLDVNYTVNLTNPTEINDTNSSLLQIQEQENNLCINHPIKRAKYRLPDDQSVQLCSKCAVTMVGQGFKVEEVNDSNPAQIRRKEIEDFLEKITQQVPNMETVFQSLITKKEEVKKYYEQQIQKVQNFFQQIQNIISNLSNDAQENVQKNFNEVDKIYEDYISQMKMQVAEAQGMQKDIYQNVERIITQIELQPFREIMNQYRGNLDKFTMKLQQVQSLPVDVLRVSIPNMEDQFLQLKQLINNGLCLLQYQTTLVKKINFTTEQNSPAVKLSTLESAQNLNFNQAINGNVNGSLYVSFENKEQFKNSKDIYLYRKSKSPNILCKNHDENLDCSNIILPRQTSKSPTQQKNLLEKKNSADDKKPFRNLFIDSENKNKVEIKPKIPEKQSEKSQEKQKKENTIEESSFDDSPSQTIEKEDIENTYNLMICENESEREELQQHISEINKGNNNQKQEDGGIPLFCSPQFKDH